MKLIALLFTFTTIVSMSAATYYFFAEGYWLIKYEKQMTVQAIEALKTRCWRNGWTWAGIGLVSVFLEWLFMHL